MSKNTRRTAGRAVRGAVSTAAAAAVLFAAAGCAKDSYEQIITEYKEAAAQYAELAPEALGGDEDAKKEMEKISARMEKLNERLEKLTETATEEQRKELIEAIDSAFGSLLQ